MASLFWLLVFGIALLLAAHIISETIEWWNSFTVKEEWELFRDSILGRLK
jgi:hypothetical protein